MKQNTTDHHANNLRLAVSVALQKIQYKNELITANDYRYNLSVLTDELNNNGIFFNKDNTEQLWELFGTAISLAILKAEELERYTGETPLEQFSNYAAEIAGVTDSDLTA